MWQSWWQCGVKWIITTQPYNLTITGHEGKMTGYEWSLGKWLLRPESRRFTHRSVTSVARKNVYSPMTWQKPPRDCFNHYHVAVVIQWRTCLQIQSSCSLSCNETMKSLTRSRNWALAFWNMLAQLSLWRWIFSISDLCCTFQQNKFYFHLYFNSWLQVLQTNKKNTSGLPMVSLLLDTPMTSISKSNYHIQKIFRKLDLWPWTWDQGVKLFWNF